MYSFVLSNRWGGSVMRKTMLAAGALAVALVGGGFAFDGEAQAASYSFAIPTFVFPSGTGGRAINNCAQVGVVVGSGIGVLGGSGYAVGASCYASASGIHG
jgi:hypothetical protein